MKFNIAGRLMVDFTGVVWVGPHQGWAQHYPTTLEDTKIHGAYSDQPLPFPEPLGRQYPRVAQRLESMGMSPMGSLDISYHRGSDGMDLSTPEGSYSKVLFEMEPRFLDPAHEPLARAIRVDRILRSAIGPWCRTHNFADVYEQVQAGPLQALMDLPPDELDEADLEFVKDEGMDDALQAWEADLQKAVDATAHQAESADAAIAAMAAISEDGVYDIPLLARTQRLTFPAFDSPSDGDGITLSVPEEVVWVVLDADQDPLPPEPKHTQPTTSAPTSWWRKLLGW